MLLNLIEQINALSDDDAVAFLQYFNQCLLDGIQEDFDVLIDKIPKEIKSKPEFSEIDRLSLDEKAFIEGQEAIAFSRNMLTILAQDERFSPLLERAMEEYMNIEDLSLGIADDQVIKKRLSLTLTASMCLISAVDCSIPIVLFGTAMTINPAVAVSALVLSFLQVGQPIIESTKEDKSTPKNK